MAFNLNNHSIWQEFAVILGQINPNALAKSHLEACNYKVMGYYDEDDYYEEVEFITPIDVELTSSSLNLKNQETNTSRWVTLNFSLKAVNAHKEQSVDNEDEIEEVGELKLIFDSNMNFIDENWEIYIESPFVIAKKENVTQELSVA
ncbi:hypothetical protein NIES4071_40910 [Calothrix sp. NIES-4071]|nr:hypothetical protein NIES4071_40910 [Calothrix sp. NIES-4071]BAZ58407.1 hypothetical protein NIES4105_40850 [Calothrix sp. NIES-4105]